MDAYAGISRGVEQITVRASRRLAPEPELTVIGPIRYEVVEPLQTIRFVLEPNDVQPIAFDWRFEGVVPARAEDRTHIRTGYRVSADLVRFHQIGVCSGWVEIDGERHEMDPDTWVSTRDHSWGVRYGVGAEPTDVEPRELGAGEHATTSCGHRCSWNVPTAPATASSSTSGSPQVRDTSTRR